MIDDGSGPRPARPRQGRCLHSSCARRSARGQGLVKRYGDRTVVDGLDLTAAMGAVVAVLGPNGAGKTTTIESCEGLRRPDAGDVRVLGLDPGAGRGRAAAAGRRDAPGRRLPTGARAGELLAPRRRAARRARSTARPRRAARPRARRADARSGGCPAGSSSGSRWRWRVVGRPELVFLDEPTAGLDPQARLAVWDLVRALRADGVAVVLTTHLMDEAERLADAGRRGRPRPGRGPGLARRAHLGGAGAAAASTARPGLDLVGAAGRAARRPPWPSEPAPGVHRRGRAWTRRCSPRSTAGARRTTCMPEGLAVGRARSRTSSSS